MEWKNRPGYNLKPLVCKSDHELIQKMIYAYSCYNVLRGRNEKPLREKLTMILAHYLILGYNKESKKEVIKLCGLKNEVDLNCLNKELRDQNYLIKGYHNERNNELDPGLKVLKEYFDAIKTQDDMSLNMNFYLTKDEKGDSF